MVSCVPGTVLGLKHGRDSRLIIGSEGLGFNKPKQNGREVFHVFIQQNFPDPVRPGSGKGGHPIRPGDARV